MHHDVIVEVYLESYCFDSCFVLSILYDTEIIRSFEKLTEPGIWNKGMTQDFMCEYATN